MLFQKGPICKYHVGCLWLSFGKYKILWNQ